MYQGLIIVGLASAAIVGLSATFPRLTDGGLTPAASASDLKDEERLYLTSKQSAESAAMGLLPPRTRSLLRIDKAMRHGDFVWNESGVPPGDISVRVDLSKQMLSVFRSGHEIGTAVVLFGAEGKDTPLGTFPVLARIRDHRSATYNAPMPFTLRLTPDGVAIHGSDVRWGAATHGCIGVPSEFAERLFEHTKLGDRVEIVSSSTSTRP